jgi:hypothetical protein
MSPTFALMLGGRDGQRVHGALDARHEAGVDPTGGRVERHQAPQAEPGRLVRVTDLGERAAHVDPVADARDGVHGAVDGMRRPVRRVGADDRRVLDAHGAGRGADQAGRAGGHRHRGR